MRFKEIIGRLTGLNVLGFGANWNPPESEVTVARRVLAFLEDRRVLYVTSEVEVPMHCVRSVEDIRRYLTQEIQSLTGGRSLEGSLRAMRAACRKFMAVTEAKPDIITFGCQSGHWASWVFISALGELRGVFGVHLAMIAANYRLDIEGDLAKILPGSPEDERASD